LSAEDGQAPRIAALYGLGGAGKTSMAVEYAYRHLADVGVAWQFSAEDAALLAPGFGELAAQLGARGLIDTRDPVVSVHGMLATYPREWLLLFDNVPDRPSLEGLLPPAGRGRVLITSQNPNWPPGQGMEVPVLDRKVAAVFLVNRTGDPDEQAAAELAEQLDGLPLALEQAAAYMLATGGRLAGYLAMFRQRRPDMLARGKPTGYNSTVVATWSLAFEKLEHSAPQAAGLLRLLGNCAPEAIPLHLLLQERPGLADQLAPEVAPVLVPLLEDQLAAADAVASLRQYSLVSPPVEELLSVHRLVQAVTVDQMPAKLATAWRVATAALIEAALPPDPEQPGNWPEYAQLVPHALAALAADGDGMWKIALYLGYSGHYAAARDLFQRVVDARIKAYGPEHPETLPYCGGLAYWIGRAGDGAAARDQLAELLPVMERVFGAEHEEAISTRANLAYFTGMAGDAAAARDQLTALLPVRERVLGPEHQLVLVDRANIAFWTGQTGDAAAARDQFAELLPVRERVLGPEHPETLATRANLAYFTGMAGDAAAARDQFAELLPVRERVLGPEHPDTLTTRDHLASFTGLAGDAAGARDQFAELLPIRERVLGPEHWDTLSTRVRLASWTGEAGDAAGARDQFAALLPIMERVLGPEHPDTLETRHNLAYWTEQADRTAN
jgi:hypothetical protein